ncbi:hypothetical protein, partial [Akkermansia sp.]|uniref:hypothetical protein n=1 Tax=Akkermansia sp. TaxID=1872421 RepID=UPI0025BFD6B2
MSATLLFPVLVPNPNVHSFSLEFFCVEKKASVPIRAERFAGRVVLKETAHPVLNELASSLQFTWELLEDWLAGENPSSNVTAPCPETVANSRVAVRNNVFFISMRCSNRNVNHPIGTYTVTDFKS